MIRIKGPQRWPSTLDFPLGRALSLFFLELTVSAQRRRRMKQWVSHSGMADGAGLGYFAQMLSV